MRTKLLLSALAAAALLVGCGDDDDGGGGSEDPADVLLTALTKDSPDIESANANLSISGSLGGDQGGDFSLTLDGPFHFAGEGTPGALDWTVDASANTPLLSTLLGTENIDFQGGLTIADEKLYVSYQDTAYEADQQVYEQIAPTLEGSLGPTATSGLDEEQAQEFIDAFADLSNEGTEDVGGEETTHLSGQLDAEGLSSLGADGENPVNIQGVDAVDFDIWIANSDDVARRVEVAASVALPEEATTFIGIDSIDFKLSSEITDLNEAEDIEAPSDAKPLSGLLEELGIDPAALGGQLPGLGSGTGTGSGNGTGGGADSAAGITSDPALQDCVSKAETSDEIAACLNQ